MKRSLSQNRVKRILCIVMTVLFMAGIVPVHAKAEDVLKIINLNQNTTISAGNSETYYPDTGKTVYTYNVYRITVPANGYIKIYSSNKSADIVITETMRSAADISSGDPVEAAYLSGKKQYFCVLPKGTFYIRLWDTGSKTNLRWTFTKVANKANYCRPKALSISKGKTYTAISYYGKEHDRWYKVKLTSKRALYIKCKSIDGDGVGADIAVYDARGIKKKVKLSNITYRTAKLPKGTYYIRLRKDDMWQDYGRDYFGGRLCQLSWSVK